MMSELSVETKLDKCNQIFRTSPRVVENDKHGRMGQVVHDTVELMDGGGRLGRWHDHARFSLSKIPRHNKTQVHELLSFGVWLGVRVVGRVVGSYCKICAVAVSGSILASIAPVETHLVDVRQRCVAGAVEEAPHIVLVTVPLLHIQPFDLKTLPQDGVLNPFNLENPSAA